ncbi:hypothetical protein Sdiek1_1739 [Sulfurospirillum diekertiae]|uniref:Uncharacterized protein n=1 Tax=Sulfurospirillum diekertiae TaxID=1854492 RepID=A0A1Y0HLC0_9BACT|nr:hypothetical protein [Sulfurospirillum diekertiae]ARU48899.1 hypothetical protein Sdiek1_1739 [Sulfurospirillum diekertiae]
MCKKILWLIFFTCNLLLAETNSTLKLEDAMKTEVLHQKVAAIDETIQNNLWYKRYGNYLSYQKLIEELSTVDAELKKVKTAKDKVSVEKRERLTSKQESLEKQIELLQEFKNSPFSKIIESTDLETYPKITNPLAIISALSYIKKNQTR